MYNANRRAYLGVKDMTLITPSKWLANLTRESFLKCYPVQVVNNKIDETVFKPTPSDFRERNHMEGKFLILGVASTWEARKGLDDFMKLAMLINSKVRIVLVGLSKKQIAKCPGNVIGIMRTNSAKELAEIYSAVDVFFNPTKEENFPTVNLEARACGCRIVTYDTGGSSETVEGYGRAIVLSGTDMTPEGFLRAMDGIM